MSRKTKKLVRSRAFLQQLPLPMAALALAIAASGNFADWLRPPCGITALLLWIGVLLKCLLVPWVFIRELQDDVLAGVWPTFFMAGMNLAVYAQLDLGWMKFAKLFWLVMLVLHMGWMIFLCARLIKQRQWQSVSPTLLVTYVGIAVGAITAPPFGMQRLGLLLVCWGVMAAIVCCSLLLVQKLCYPVAAEGRKPLVFIYAAPISLCLTGYLQCAEMPRVFGVWFALAGVLLCYMAVLPMLPSLIRMPFYPSKAALTFPMVISALAVGQSVTFLESTGYVSSFLSMLVLAQESIAAALTIYVLCSFARQLFCSLKSAIRISDRHV